MRVVNGSYGRSFAAATDAQGADILRVHNVQAGVDAARVADAVWPKSVLNEGLRNL